MPLCTVGACCQPLILFPLASSCEVTSNLDAVDKLVAHVEELCAALQVFFLQRDKQANGPANPTSYSRLTERLARAFCLALCPYLKLLKEDGMAKLGLRVTLETQQARAFLIG